MEDEPTVVVHVTEIHHEGTTRPGEALMRKMLWTMDAHVGRPSWQLDTERDNILQFTPLPPWSQG